MKNGTGIQTIGAQVTLNDLNVYFRSARSEEVHAVRDFTLTTEPGEFVCLIGPSGCGKSTVLNVVAGFVEASSGQVAMDDKSILKPAPDRGVVFQDYALFPWLSVLRNVEFGLKMQGVDKTERQQIALEKIEQVGLLGFESKYPHELSGGMQQRVGIARILASNPRVMLMDEPFGALDAQTRETMQELLLEVWEHYRTSVIFVTHDLDEAIFLSDKICLMTARPGTVKVIIENPLPRPRTADIYMSEEFMQIKRRLTSTLREEIKTAMAQNI
jgi:NitT/TauT family transport system ATP-binding protein